MRVQLLFQTDGRVVEELGWERCSQAVTMWWLWCYWDHLDRVD